MRLRGQEAEPIASRVMEVGREVERLVGLSAAQFRQVILLPQGRFAEVLRAGAEEREALLNETLQLPSLNINGFQSAGVGKHSANVIPTQAIASLDLRLVVGNDWKRQQQKVIDHRGRQRCSACHLMDQLAADLKYGP